jgi:hypothetical protein
MKTGILSSFSSASNAAASQLSPARYEGDRSQENGREPNEQENWEQEKKNSKPMGEAELRNKFRVLLYRSLSSLDLYLQIHPSWSKKKKVLGSDCLKHKPLG